MVNLSFSILINVGFKISRSSFRLGNSIYTLHARRSPSKSLMDGNHPRALKQHSPYTTRLVVLKTIVYGNEPFQLCSYPPTESKIRFSRVTLRDFRRDSMQGQAEGFSEGA